MTKPPRPRFVKSATTGTSVESSRAELNRILARYGCTAFGYEADPEARETRITFRVPNAPGSHERVPVQLVVRVADVAVMLYGPTSKVRRYARGYGSAGCAAGEHWPKEWEQAERVAWRHLVLWVDAACTAAGAGLTTMAEAFHAHVLVRDQQGCVGRMADFARTLAEAGTMKLLPPGDS